MVIAGLAVVGLAALSMLFMIGGGADTAKNYFGPMMGQALVVLWLAPLAVAGLGYAIYRVRR
jgi:ABC-type antimicrobial peptide transport system permease subunit